MSPSAVLRALRAAERHSPAPSIRICLNPEWACPRLTPVGRASTNVLFVRDDRYGRSPTIQRLKPAQG